MSEISLEEIEIMQKYYNMKIERATTESKKQYYIGKLDALRNILNLIAGKGVAVYIHEIKKMKEESQ